MLTGAGSGKYTASCSINLALVELRPSGVDQNTSLDHCTTFEKKKRINEIWSSPNIPFLHSRVKLVQVNLSLKNIKRNKLMSKQNVKSDQNLCFDAKVSIINIRSQTLFCNFIFGVLNFYFIFFFKLILETKKSQNYNISMEA